MGRLGVGPRRPCRWPVGTANMWARRAPAMGRPAPGGTPYFGFVANAVASMTAPRLSSGSMPAVTCAMPAACSLVG